MEDIKYPIGRYQEEAFSETALRERIAEINILPRALEAAIENLDEQQLQTAYRDGGWTVHQLVHHVADSHMNAFIRFKLGLTEDNPVIKPYRQDDWVKLEDVMQVPINVSVTILHAVHQRWTSLLNNISEPDWQRTLLHPEYQKTMTLWYLLGLYAWHSRHHVAHINALRHRMNW
jgi:uncharacterized damage-inducible protein DinB